jgi:hypothetical protein
MANDAFGWSIAKRGLRVVVGAPGADTACIPACDTGLAHVFLDDGSTLTHVATLGAPDAAEDDEFGYAVAVDGATIVVGAPGDDDAGTSSGSAYIYQGASFVAKLTASDAAANHSFGRTVAIDGDTVVIGWGGLEAVYVFERHHGGPNNWGEVKKLTPPEPSLAFGWAVAISGDLIVVGAPYDANDVPYGGAAHIFERDEGGPGQWGRIAKIILDPPDAWSLLGRSVSIDGSTVILGRDTGDMNGAAHIYERDQGGPDQWGLVASLFDFSDPYGTIKFGWSVSIRGDIAVAGAPSGYDGNCDPGTVYVYQRDHGGPDNWGRIARMSDPDMWQADYLGHSVSIDGARVVMGAPGPSFSCCSDCPGWAYAVDLDVCAETLIDCNENGLHDDCDIADGTSLDCNENGVPDECDIDDGTSLDINDNGVPDECECIGDCSLPADGVVNVSDFLAMLSQWDNVGSSCDINGGGVGVTDFLALLAHWGPCP